jgi:Tfp pilus assembly protein PilX
MRIFKRLRPENGIATFIALMVMLMMTILGLSVLKLAEDEITIAGNELNEMSAFYASEAGLEKASASIQDQYNKTNAPPTQLPAGSENINGNTVTTYVTKDLGAAIQETLVKGALAGLKARVKTYRIESIGTSLVDGGQMRLSQDFECALIPLFQFAVFYENDLEIAPGPDMNLSGRIHTNGNLWLQAGGKLNIDSYVTSAGDLLHGRKGAGGVSDGDVFIKDMDGNYQNMKNADGTFLSSTSTNWYDSAVSRWSGRVRDAAFGQKKMNLPLSNSGDPHKIIERGSSNPDSYEHKAGFKIIDGDAYAPFGGVWSDVTALLPAGTITTKSFEDGREGKTVNATEVDMSLLKSSSYFPDNGVIYASDQRSGTFNALRLTNGPDVGKPVSVYSENPMYVKGDFNSVNKQPVSLAADAVTFLSNNWDDVLSGASKSGRIASQTICNASVMTGNTNTTSSDYNGGLENLPRFLEDWTDKRFTWRGSMVNLWNSQHATGDWGGDYYTPPNRDWAYDTDLDDPAKMPPATPQVRVFMRTGWSQKDIGYIP